MNKLLLSAFLLCSFYTGYSQPFQAIKIVSYRAMQGQSNTDTLQIGKVEPQDLDHFIKLHDSVAVYLYIPNCPGLVKYFDEEKEVLRSCLSRGISVAFVAVSEKQLSLMPSRVVDKHGLYGMHCFVINQTVQTKLYEAVLNKSNARKMRDFFLFVKGRPVLQEWGYKMTPKKVEAALMTAAQVNTNVAP